MQSCNADFWQGFSFATIYWHWNREEGTVNSFGFITVLFFDWQWFQCRKILTFFLERTNKRNWKEKIKTRAIVCPLKARIDHDGALNRSHSNPSPFLQSSVQKNYLVIFVSLRWLRRRKKFAAKMSQYVDQVSQRTKITNKRKYFRNCFAARKKLTIEPNGWILTGISWPKVMHVRN